MSFALQWRYNFGRLFGAVEAKSAEPDACELDAVE